MLFPKIPLKKPVFGQDQTLIHHRLIFMRLAVKTNQVSKPKIKKFSGTNFVKGNNQTLK